MKPSKLDQKQVFSILKTFVYIGFSGAISALLSYATDNKDMFGLYWPLINILLVTLKQVFTKPSVQ